ncbi:hypothetical protein E4U41_002799 [Claviceps citrina]|nr:hypothetical protein E4U41_002799 [Claviceps citrina]
MAAAAARTATRIGASPPNARSRPATGIATATSTCRASGTAARGGGMLWMASRRASAENPAETGKAYCANHLCEVRSCDRPRHGRFVYCVDHKCDEHGCHRLRKRQAAEAAAAATFPPQLHFGRGGGGGGGGGAAPATAAGAAAWGGGGFGYCDFHNCKYGGGCDNLVTENDALCWRHRMR